MHALWAVPLLCIAGALADPALIPPWGPLAVPAEQVGTNFTACGPRRGPACVVDGDTFKLGQRKIRIIGIDAPELAAPQCRREAALASKSATRLRELLNQGPFEMVAHRLRRQDRHGRDLMVVRRDGVSIGGQLVDEGLAERFVGSKIGWCG